ncbi:Nudix family hydrolase [Acidiferrobacter sp.]|uniref:Nudix family hydrolase n=1 Tax=Acidiferrobacter sp. TaxID=1872107 RepID=UPI0026384105|nr:Nudix family hydrolase [Acidiferrobacter sp.]
MSASTGPTGPEGVVAAIIRDDDGRVLVARRPAGKVGAGLWEFPGGKVGAGESQGEALRRELYEELDITVGACTFLPHYRAAAPPGIDLAFWRVDAYEGVARGREGQEIRWGLPDALPDLPFLPADRPILARLRLPSFYLISDVDRFGEALFEKRLVEAAARDALLVQLREPWPASRLRAYAQHLRALLAPYGGRLIVNGDPDELVGAADGTHLSAARLARVDTRPVAALVGASCHDVGELRRAAAVGCDFAVLSPVKPTPSHPDATPLGWARFRELAAEVLLPIYALGGMTTADRVVAEAHLAQGVALRSGIFGLKVAGSIVS